MDTQHTQAPGANDAGMLARLIQAMRQSRGSGLLGAGMAQQGAQALASRPEYLRYAHDAMASGQQPMPFEQWAQQAQMPQQGASASKRFGW